jgi:integrase
MLFSAMTTPNDNQMTGAKRTTRLTRISKDGKWKSYLANQGLMQYLPSGIFFARAKVNRTVRRSSLETDIFSTAKDRLDAKKKELRQPPAEVGTFAEARLLYLADIENDHALAPKTKRYWHYRVKALLKSWPELDGMKLDKITEPQCRAWVNRFTAKFAAVNFNNTLAALRNILKRGGLGRDKNPAFGTKHGTKWRLGTKLKQMTLPEPEQFEQLVKTIESGRGWRANDCANFVRFLAFSGCRISEAALVQWQDVDLEHGEIRIHNAKRSKTTSAHDLRFVPIIPAMRELLERLHRELSPKPADRVCAVIECKDTLTRACESIGVARITHHDLRHLFATRCIEAGVDIPTVSRWLGHVDGGALAMKVYGHLRRSHSQQAAQLVTFGTAAIVPEIVEPKMLTMAAGATA